MRSVPSSGSTPTRLCLVRHGESRAATPDNPFPLVDGQGDPELGPQGREQAEKLGCTLALYNHGDWFGEPENQIRIIETMGSEKVRIVYNFHHGHHQVERFESMFRLMLPYLTCININGMRVDGPKIITVGDGDREVEMLRIIRASEYTGPIGILGHTEGEDILPVLERNLKGLERIRSLL